MRQNKEVSTLETKEGFVNLNFETAAWLLQTKQQNAKFFAQKEFTTRHEYVWSKREITPKGAPLMDVIDHEISRIKYASD